MKDCPARRKLRFWLALALALSGCSGASSAKGTSGGSGGDEATGGSTGGNRGGQGGATGGAAGRDAGTGGSTGGSPGTGGAAGGSGGNGTGGSGTGGAGTGGSPGTGGAIGGPAAMPYDCDWGPARFSKLAPSTAAPGGLALTNVPLLVSIGFDDNAYEDGMQWILDFMKSKVNPRGSGNRCTFDGTAARVTFFINSHVGITSDALKALHGRAYREGHEAANHTDTHADTLQQNPDRAVWNKEMSTCNDYLVGLGVPRMQIIGFRTPFLQQSEATFEAIVEQKFRYDSSIEHYYGVGGFDWPYTLDAGKDATHAYQTRPTASYPGLWEMPVNELMLDTTGYTAVTGLDYNMWISKKMTRKQFVDVMKANLDIRMKGGTSPANRAPLLFGGHTDLYSRLNGEANAAAAASVNDRRAAVEEFIDYALSYDGAVRIVPYAEVLHWMQAPVGLDGAKGK
jgi:Polysaccharide deacetylase